VYEYLNKQVNITLWVRAHIPWQVYL